MSFFNVRIPGGPMTVIAAAGQEVAEVEVDEFQIATAESAHAHPDRPAGSTAAFDVTASEQGDWAFHCHLLWSHAAGPHFEPQAGLRLDVEPDLRSHLVLGGPGARALYAACRWRGVRVGWWRSQRADQGQTRPKTSRAPGQGYPDGLALLSGLRAWF